METINTIILNKYKMLYDRAKNTTYRGSLDRLITEIESMKWLIIEIYENELIEKETYRRCRDLESMSMAQIRAHYQQR